MMSVAVTLLAGPFGWAFEQATGAFAYLKTPLAALVGSGVAENLLAPAAIGGYCMVVAAAITGGTQIFLRVTDRNADKRTIAEQDAELKALRAQARG